MHVGAFGFDAVITTNLDLTTTTAAKVDILRPDGTGVEKLMSTLQFVAPVFPALLWVVKIPIEVGDLTIAGTYSIQFTDTTPERNLPCSIGYFNVLPNVVFQG